MAPILRGHFEWNYRNWRGSFYAEELHVIARGFREPA